MHRSFLKGTLSSGQTADSVLEDLFDGDSDEDEESGDEDERGTAADFERVLTAGMERVLDGKMKAKKMKDVSVLASRCSCLFTDPCFCPQWAVPPLPSYTPISSSLGSPAPPPETQEAVSSTRPSPLALDQLDSTDWLGNASSSSDDDSAEEDQGPSTMSTQE